MSKVKKSGKRKLKKIVQVKQELTEWGDEETLNSLRRSSQSKPCTMDELFIQCIRQYPCLWDTQLPSYKNFHLRDEAWKEIANKTLVSSATAAKAKWKNLRDTHREALKKIAKKNLNGITQSTKAWRYMRHMEFLLPHMNSDIQVPEDNKVVGNGQNVPNLTEVFKLEIESGNALKSFFDSMYESTRIMPDSFQRLIKKKIFQAVMEAEDSIADNSFMDYDSSSIINGEINEIACSPNSTKPMLSESEPVTVAQNLGEESITGA